MLIRCIAMILSCVVGHICESFNNLNKSSSFLSSFQVNRLIVPVRLKDVCYLVSVYVYRRIFLYIVHSWYVFKISDFSFIWDFKHLRQCESSKILKYKKEFLQAKFEFSDVTSADDRDALYVVEKSFYCIWWLHCQLKTGRNDNVIYSLWIIS